MGHAVVLGPLYEPLSLAEAKAHCRVDSTDDDGLIAGYILAARNYVESQIHRPIVSRLYSHTIDWDWPTKCGSQWIELSFPPLVAVRSITYVDGDGVTQTLASSQYRAMTNRPKGTIVPAHNVTWPTVRCQTEAITVNFVAGYTAFTDTTTSPNATVTPTGTQNDIDTLRTAIQLLVGHFYENREASVQQALIELPMGVEALISPYRSHSL